MSQWIAASCSYDTRYIHVCVHVMHNVCVFTVFRMLHVQSNHGRIIEKGTTHQTKISKSVFIIVIINNVPAPSYIQNKVVFIEINFD